jgi:regulator of protease activity HflC (stomatin/prohibitin superfamily)
MPDLFLLFLIIALFSISGWLAFRRMLTRVIVNEWEWGVLVRNGRIKGVLEPGAYWLRTLGTDVHRHDRREIVEVVPGQDVLTKDNVGLKVSLLIETVITDPIALMRSTEYGQFVVHSSAQIALREAISERTLDELLEDRTAISDATKTALAVSLSSKGFETKDVQVRDIMLAKELREIYAGLIVARKQGEIALERARGESASLRNLANAARLLKDNPELLPLRVIQAMTAPEAQGNTFVVGNALEATAPRRGDEA